MLPRLSGRQPEEEEGQCCARAPPKCQLVFSLTVIDRQARHAKTESRGDVRVVDTLACHVVLVCSFMRSGTKSENKVSFFSTLLLSFPSASRSVRECEFGCAGAHERARTRARQYI